MELSPLYIAMTARLSSGFGALMISERFVSRAGRLLHQTRT